MAKQSLADFATDDVLLQLDQLAGALSVTEWKGGGNRPTRKQEPITDFPMIDFASMKVFGVREAKDSLSKLLNDASVGKMQFVASGDGTPVLIISVDKLAEAVASIGNQRSVTVADAISQLPYSAEELVPVQLSRRTPTRGIVREFATEQES